MIIHFICRGNSFRSIIAEAYLNSLEIKDSGVLSSGTVAASEKAGNLTYYRMTLELLEKHGIREFAKAGYGDQLTQSRLEKADITVCMNQRIYDECMQYVTFPASPHIWSVADIGEPGRVAHTESESRRYREEAYREIVKNVDRLISDISVASLFDRLRSHGGRCGFSGSCLLGLREREDLQRHPHLTHVVIVASDSDYTSLAQQCRRHGRFFIGIGTTRTASSYKFACDEFRFYRDLAAASASPAAAEADKTAQELAPLEDAAELVAKAVRMLAAGRGESWALKAAVRPLVKRLDPAFDERNFGFATFTELLRALDGSIVERPGEYDHELAVRADIDGQVRSPGGTAVASSTPALLVERQLRRRGLRLPAERRTMWTVLELIVDAFGASSTVVEPSFESLRLKIEPGAAALGFVLTDVDFNKLKGILWRGHVFEVYGHDRGISLRVPNLEQLRYRLVSVLLENLADPAVEDPALLAEAFFGPSPTDEQKEVVDHALQALLEGRNQIETADS